MNSPVPTNRRPPRAQPIQPDRPGQQDGTQADDEPSQEERDREEFSRSAKQQREQSEGAVENVREGYD